MKFEGYYVHPNQVSMDTGAMKGHLYYHAANVAEIPLQFQSPHQIQWAQLERLITVYNQLFTYNYN